MHRILEVFFQFLMQMQSKPFVLQKEVSLLDLEASFLHSGERLSAHGSGLISENEQFIVADLRWGWGRGSLCPVLLHLLSGQVTGDRDKDVSILGSSAFALPGVCLLWISAFIHNREVPDVEVVIAAGGRCLLDLVTIIVFTTNVCKG